jgi:hypothetical protein
VPNYEVDDLNRVGSARAATIAASIRRREEWKPCRKRRPPFAIRGPKRICGNSKPIRKQGHLCEVAKAMKRTEAAVRQKAKTIGVGLGHRR